MDLRGWKTWDGEQWRDYKAGDELLPGVMVFGNIAGVGRLDPSIPVITKPEAVQNVKTQHDRYRGTGGD